MNGVIACLAILSTCSCFILAQPSVMLDVKIDRDLVDRIIGVLLLARMENDIQMG